MSTLPPARLLSLAPCLTLAGCTTSSAVPATHTCLDLDRGAMRPLGTPADVYGVGLAYAGHLQETSQNPSPEPLVFRNAWTPPTPEVTVPSTEALIARMDDMEPGLSAALLEQEVAITPLVDWEVELGVVVLETPVPGEPPKLGFFTANDLSERSLAVLGDGPDRLRYWGASKSHPGFLPTSTEMWVPDMPVENGIPCVSLKTWVNGDLRQSGTTSDLVYTTREILDAATEQRGAPLEPGTWILTGTPAGVALSTPAWKVTLADLAGLDRFSRLGAVQRGGGFLEAGDVVEVAVGDLGRVRSVLVAR